jgi:N-acetylmuramoyl-L-alanine amidase
MKSVSLVVMALLLAASTAQGQVAPQLGIEREDGSTSRTSVALGRGYAAVPLTLFGELGWTVSVRTNDVLISVPGEITIDLRIGSPFFTWDGMVLQLADAPYREGESVFVPLQLLTDFLPRRLPDLYDFDGARSLLRAGDPVPAGDRQAAVQEDPIPVGPSEYDGVRVVVIDAGHGGGDPGAIGVGGIREKDVALKIALELARVLRREPDLEVHLTRDDDTFVDLWDRGEIATNLKGDRPGLFVSIHGNSFPEQRGTRGFETYFLSEARTEHERRVSAIENAPLRLQGQAWRAPRYRPRHRRIRRRLRPGPPHRRVPVGQPLALRRSQFLLEEHRRERHHLFERKHHAPALQHDQHRVLLQHPQLLGAGL